MPQRCRVCQSTQMVRTFAAVPLCAACDAAIARETLTRIPPIQAALRVGEAAGVRSNLMALIDHALEQAERLYRYERLGIFTTSPAPSCLLQDLGARRITLLRVAAGQAPPGRRPHARQEACGAAA
jgi:hypothetical protein